MLDKELQDVCEAWAQKVADDLYISLNEALKKSERSNDQNAALRFTKNVNVKDGGVKVQILASGDYWAFIDEGVDGTEVKHGSPYSFKGKFAKPKAIEKWIKAEALNPQKIIAEIELKRKGLSKTNRTLSRPKKKLSFNEAAKRLSFIIGRSIAKKGIEPKPFIDKVINEVRLKELTDSLSEVMGREITGQLDLSNEFRNIRISL